MDDLNVADVLATAGASFRQRGRSIVFRCPVHDDHRPSAIGGEKGWRCFACGAKGGLLDLGIALGLGNDRASVARRLEAWRP